MESSKTVSAILKLWVLLLAAAALYYIWQDRSAPQLAGQVEQAEEITHTDVAVRIGAIQKMTLHGYIVGYGNVEAAPATADKPAAEARVTVNWPANVLQVLCIEGQHVDEGQKLFVIKSARLSVDNQPASETVTSPISGTVVSIDIHPGEAALPTTTAVRIVDLDRLVVAIGIPAWQANAISAGQNAKVEIPADAKNGSLATFESKVERVDPAVDPKTNLVSVDISVPHGQSVRPGQFARVSVAQQEKPDCLVVPADSIVRDSLDRPFVAIVSDDHKQATLKLVEPGLRDGDWVQVTAPGLEAGQTIVVSGAYGLLFRSDIKVLNP
ncbi:MAG TPA: efflux RND transporter periplasmic adaptor subunit [Tepidisphaeraceae bacterium]|jgi:multidrug efflux pump subunit AcrA (membrane-fusion protein)